MVQVGLSSIHVSQAEWPSSVGYQYLCGAFVDRQNLGTKSIDKRVKQKDMLWHNVLVVCIIL